MSINTLVDLERGQGNPTLETLFSVINVLGLEVSLDIKRLSYSK